MSEADKMFEKLGYEKIDKEELKHIRYKSECANAISENIWFHKIFNKLEIFYWDKKEKKEMTKPISMKELQAINMKCKELGWLE